MPLLLLLLLCCLSPALRAAESGDFAAWLEELKSEARSSGISEQTLNLAFAEVETPIERVVELDRSQPEFVQTFTGYMQNRMSQA
ncbi:MAG TPA: lytic murein transglycosylase, partial [Pseudomonadaceae bacterium]|nr:lytic murein transglycosylase [Pseudomonadaceae bacterium]